MIMDSGKRQTPLSLEEIVKKHLLPNFMDRSSEKIIAAQPKKKEPAKEVEKI